MTEMMIRANDVDLCVEPFGKSGDPALLLLAGGATSMLGWDDDLCERLAAGSRLVIRYDHRDTGRSVSHPAGDASYRLTDLVDDAVGILDNFDIPAAHLVGFSLGGGIAQGVALDHRDRVATLTLVASSPSGPGGGDPDLDWMTAETMRRFETLGEPPSDREGLIEHWVEHGRLCASPHVEFDTESAREATARAVDRSRDLTALENHQAVAFTRWQRERLSELDVSTLVLHGDDDPVLPYRHGVALAEEISGAQFVRLEQCGHELPQRVWGTVIDAILNHTA